MNSYIIIGAPRTGKSHLLKGRLVKVNIKSLLLYDENREYDFYKKPFLEPEQFIDTAGKVREAVIAFEEATTFVNHNPDPIIKKLLALKWHRKNTMFWIFHSFRDVPMYVWNKSTHAIIFKTNDSADFVNSRFKHPILNDAFKEVRDSEWIYTGANYPGTNEPIRYSKHKIISIYGL